MKKPFLAAAVLLVLSFPLIASADPIGTGTMYIEASGPNVTPYLGDYDIRAGSYTSLTGNIEIDSLEIFCVSADHMTNPNPLVPFSFYSATNIFTVNANLLTWIANYSYNSSDNEKVDGQAAIWQTLGIVTTSKAALAYFTNTNEDGVYDKAVNKDEFVNQWLVGMNPDISVKQYSSSGNGGNQEYLVKASVPEPDAMLLVGFSVIGLAGLRRRKKVN